jgi:hypothetical protein
MNKNMRTKMNFDHERGSVFRYKRAIFRPILFLAGIFIFSGVVMLLWNNILPDVTGVHTITLWQAMEILALSKILFSGLIGRHDHGRHHHQHLGKDLRDKWLQMNPEDREKMRDEMKNEWRQKFDQPKRQE